jgi:hypothetical protein
METTMPVLLFVMNLSTLGLLWFGRAEINQGGAKVGEVVTQIFVGNARQDEQMSQSSILSTKY